MEYKNKNNYYKRNISRTVSLCDMDTISPLSDLNGSNNKNNMNLQIDMYNNNKSRHKMRKTHIQSVHIQIKSIKQN